jgi:hypothetical protein
LVEILGNNAEFTPLHTTVQIQPDMLELYFGNPYSEIRRWYTESWITHVLVEAAHLTDLIY